jgi:hypothetical protein
MDMVNIIKDFAFDDITRAVAKRNHREIVVIIEMAIESRRNVGLWTTSENSERWIFISSHQLKGPIQGENCMFCGEYFLAHNPRIVCSCPRENEWYADDDYNSDDEEFNKYDWI